MAEEKEKTAEIQKTVFSCVYDRTFFKDEQTGFSYFSVRTSDEHVVRSDKFDSVLCSGTIQHLPPKTPLTITGILSTNAKGNPYYEVVDYKTGSAGRRAAVEFLAGEVFSGVGERNAEEILDVTGDDIFAFCRGEGAFEKLRAAGVRTKIALTVIEKITEIESVKEIIGYLARFGGTYECAMKIFDKYGPESMKVITGNPYALVEAGVPFYICEHAGTEAGIKTHDQRRVKALLAACFQKAVSCGNTKMTLQSIQTIAASIEKNANAGHETSLLYLMAGLIDNKYKIENEDGAIGIYHPDWYETEKRIAENVVRLSRGSVRKKVTDEMIQSIEDECGIQYSAEQKKAFKLIESPGIAILTGGPGTGKTTVVNGLLRAFKALNPGGVITLCAPTGCAAKRLQEATGVRAQTVHKLLDIKPYGDKMLQMKDEYDQLDADMLIVDESSMMDEELMLMLIRAVKSGAVFLMVGDEDQLPSVGAGNVLHDLLEIKEIKNCRLKQVFRQQGESLIVENSIRIRQGRTDLKEGDDFEILRVDTAEDLKNAAVSCAAKYYKRGCPSHVRIYSPARAKKFLSSTYNLNNVMHETFNKKGPSESITFGGRTFSVGDPVIFTKNNYKLGYYNGEDGIVTAVKENGAERAIVIDKEGVDIEVSGKEISEVDLSYAITAHKSQGSECDIAVVLMPAEPANMLERSLIYVAATRAKKKNIIITQGESLSKAIQTARTHSRKTGLKDRIKYLFALPAGR